MLAVLVGVFVDPAVELNVDSNIISREFPWVEVKPVIGNFDLVPIINLLLKDTVSVSQAVAPCGIIEGSQTVEKAGSQSTETAVAESCIVFLRDDIFDSEAKLGQTI